MLLESLQKTFSLKERRAITVTSKLYCFCFIMSRVNQNSQLLCKFVCVVSSHCVCPLIRRVLEIYDRYGFLITEEKTHISAHSILPLPTSPLSPSANRGKNNHLFHCGRSICFWEHNKHYNPHIVVLGLEELGNPCAA